MNSTVFEAFTIEFDFGLNGATEENARFAEVWDGPVIIATLMRKGGDMWTVDHVDTDYVEPHHMEDAYPTIGEFIAFLDSEVNA